MTETPRTGPRRGLAAALLGLAFGTAGGAVVVKAPPKQDAKALQAASAALIAPAAQALEGLTKALEPIAVEASRVPELGAGFANRIDAATFQDLLESEDGWRSYREKGRASALFADGKELANLFVERPAPDARELIGRALTGRSASGLARGDGRAYAVAAARVEDRHAAAAKAVVMIGTPLDKDALAGAATSVGGALALSDGKRILVSAGPPASVAGTGSLAGREAEAPLLGEGRRPIAATALGGGLWLWVVGATPLPESEAASNPATVGLGILAAALALAGIILATRRGVPPPPPAKKRSSSSAPAASSSSPTNERPTVTTRPAPPRSEPLGHRPTEAASASQLVAKSDTGSDLAGRYTLLEQIGEGGMAEVYRATLHGAEGFQRPLVVKRLLPHLTNNKDVVGQFIDEARLQASLAHANIVSVLDFGRAGKDHFLALEYIRGRDLDKVLARNLAQFSKPLDLPMAAYIICEVLSALAYAHTKTDKDGVPMEIVHRDVSLGNVLVSYMGEVKLSDFGIVKAEGRVSKTQVGMIKGNAAFMAPEQARGQAVDARADLFAVGAVLYSCVTGHTLYGNDTAMNQLLRAVVGPATEQHQRIDGVTPALAPILHRALALEPSNRFASAAEFARILRPLGATVNREDVAELMRVLFTEEMTHEE